MPKELTDQQLLALEMFVGGARVKEIAKALGIDRRTLYDWRSRNVRFRQEYERLRDEMHRFTIDRIRNLMWLSLDRLEIQLRDPHAPTSRPAARAVLTMAGVPQVLTAQTVEATRDDYPDQTDDPEESEPPAS